MRENMTIEEVGREAAEQALVETALAFHYHNPYCQYNHEIEIVANQDKMVSQETTPEAACREIMHYEDCRGLIADIYWNALHMIIPGTRLFWHPAVTSQFGMETLVMQYGTEVGIKPYRDYDKFIEDYFKMIRPGDILMSDKPDGNSHIMMYMGKCLGDGKRYVIHDWPVGGGVMDKVTGKNKYEPAGSATLETVEELWYPGTGNPHWEHGAMEKLWLFRPLNRQIAANATLPAPSVSRLKYPKLWATKYASKSIYESVMQGDVLTITDEIENKSDKPYENLVVCEYISKNGDLDKLSMRMNGRKAGTHKVDDKRQCIEWVVNIAPGEKVKLSYKFKVRTKRDRITIPCGRIDHIETRELNFRVAEAVLAKDEEKALKALTKGAIPTELCPKKFADLDFVNAVYKKVLGKKTILPKTAQAFIEKTMYPTKEIKIYHMSEYADMLALRIPGEDTITAEGANLQKLFIERFVGGRNVFLENRRDRAFDYLEEYFKPGDCFIAAGGKNETAIVNKDELSIYVYVGNGKVLAHRTSGTTREEFADTVACALVKNIVIGLRPMNKLA